MATVVITSCDWCGLEQRGDIEVYWRDRIMSASIECPPNGISGGRYHWLLCCPCRDKLIRAVLATRDSCSLLAKEGR